MAGDVQSHLGRIYRANGQTSSFEGLAYNAIGWIVAGVDFLFLLATTAAGFVLYEEFSFNLDADPFRYIGIGLVMAMAFVLAMHGAQGYRPEAILSQRRQIRLICVLIPAALGFLLTVIFFLKLGASLSRGSIIVSTALWIAGLISLRSFWRWFLPVAVSHGTFGRRRLLLICSEDFPVWKFQDQAIRTGTTVVEVLRIRDDGSIGEDQLTRVATKPQPHLDEIVILWRDAEIGVLDAHLRLLQRSTLPVSIAFEAIIGAVVSHPKHKIGGLTCFQTQRPPFTTYESIVKRLFDIAFSVVALISLAPLITLVALAVKLDSPGPVFFRQVRKGYGGRPFQIVKFRSMSVQENGVEVRQARRGDPRVTRVGSFIRSTSIDELPQFWNVLKGEMSVVGPRPHAVAHDDFFDDQIGPYIFRRHVKPGLTGWAQVNNCRGETPNLQKMEERVALDLWYINNWSMMLDLKIVCRTVFQLHDYRAAY